MRTWDASVRRTTAAAVFVCLAMLVLPARAAPLLPGTASVAPGEPDPTGGVVQPGTGGAHPFAGPPGPGQFSGTLTTTVIKNDPSNPFAGGLTFAYRITNDAPSLSALDRMADVDFTGFLTDVSFQVPQAGVAPTMVARDVPGGTVTWSFTAAPAGPG